jgi:hypothetical protein
MPKDDPARNALDLLRKDRLAERLGLKHRTVRGWGNVEPIPHCHRPLLERIGRFLDRLLPKREGVAPGGDDEGDNPK